MEGQNRRAYCLHQGVYLCVCILYVCESVREGQRILSRQLKRKAERETILLQHEGVVSEKNLEHERNLLFY